MGGSGLAGRLYITQSFRELGFFHLVALPSSKVYSLFSWLKLVHLQVHVPDFRKGKKKEYRASNFIFSDMIWRLHLSLLLSSYRLN